MQGISCGSGRFLLVSIPGTAMSELIDSLPQTLVHLATSFGIAFLVGHSCFLPVVQDIADG